VLKIIDPNELLRLGVFVLLSGVMTGFAVALQAARRRAEIQARALRQAEETARFLAEASRMLGSSLDYETTLANVARLAVPRYADWCTVDMAAGEGTLRLVALIHADPIKAELAHELRRRYPPEPNAPHGLLGVLRNGESVLRTRITPADRERAARDPEHLELLHRMDTRSLMRVPLQARGQTLGVLSFGSAQPDRHYGPDDLALAEDLARRAAMAIDNARLYQEAREEIQERRRAAEGLRSVASRARCILWYADVEARGDEGLHWDLNLFDEEAARNLCPVEIPPGLSYVQAWYESRLPEDKARMDAFGEREVRAGRSYSQAFRCRLQDGRICWLAEDVRIEVRAPGHWNAVGVCMDITERKQAEEAMRESEARFRYIFDCNMIGIGRWDGGGSISDANDALLAILGYTREDLQAGTIGWENLTPAEYRPLEERAVEESRRTGWCTPYEKEYVRKDGSRIPVLVGGAFMDRDGEKGVFFALDLTEHRRLQEELQRRAEALAAADRRKDEFLAMLAHELRNPLAAIRNAVQVLQQMSPAEPRLTRAWEIIDRQVRHQARLLDDLLDVSRITQGRIELRREPLDLTRLVRDIAEDYRGLLEAAGLTLALALPEAPVWVEGDPTRLAQVVGNLLQNSAKFTDRGGHVSVKLAVEERTSPPSPLPGELTSPPNPLPEAGRGSQGPVPAPAHDAGPLEARHPSPLRGGAGGEVNKPGGAGGEVNPRSVAMLTVRDTGIGIELGVLPHVFEPFAQADRSLDRTRGGLGLGLALVKGLTELHGGDVRVESEGVGRGTTFTLFLPTAPAPSPSSALAPPPRAPSAGPIRILVVEDNRDAAETLRDLLELSGCRVAVAYSGPEAVAAAGPFRPEVVLCDLGLPGMDGYQVAAVLRQDPALSKTRLIAISGYGQQEDQRRSREAGFDLHLTKPVEFAELQRLLEVRPEPQGA
jgi:PAS domain S-box-containing protein